MREGKIFVAVTTKTQKVIISSSAMLWNINYRGTVTIRVSAVNIVSAAEETEDVLCSSRKLSCFFFFKPTNINQTGYIHTHTHKSFINRDCFQHLMPCLELTLQFLPEFPQSSNRLRSACISAHLEWTEGKGDEGKTAESRASPQWFR